ncbi:hypothetical protein D3C78_1125290 [compost metagenome]
MFVVVLACGQVHLQLDAVDEARPRFAHDRIELDERTDQQISHPALRFEGGIVETIIDVHAGHYGQHGVQAEAGVTQAEVRQVAELGYGHLVVQILVRQRQVITVPVAQVIGAIVLEVLLDIPAGARRQAAVEESGETQVDHRQVIGLGSISPEQTHSDQTQLQRTRRSFHDFPFTQGGRQRYSPRAGCGVATRYWPAWKISGSPPLFLYCSSCPRKIRWSPPSYWVRLRHTKVAIPPSSNGTPPAPV